MSKQSLKANVDEVSISNSNKPALSFEDKLNLRQC